ncbi:hypothetical protein M409DRAFT_55295 [Zasmidium cellare ATCC 36951]|uniref:Uncharacterized protein n=1 Tax=Zasmidium cellare ATCC 36951 TaxID=1080233 RepID=A0A6A6CIA9_ZASCE|nr:uncharacterized protein M409DRAFT_55295 [Zasmidium cellare ATCC 36951]KAF2165930.1 hypothetical protein M409DRAFT_55295 [Zasmidium cellare ATCC 36951]
MASKSKVVKLRRNERRQERRRDECRIFQMPSLAIESCARNFFGLCQYFAPAFFKRSRLRIREPGHSAADFATLPASQRSNPPVLKSENRQSSTTVCRLRDFQNTYHIKTHMIGPSPANMADHGTEAEAETDTSVKPVGPEGSSTAQLLEQRSLEIINSVNTRTFEILFKHASPTFVDSRPLGDGEVASHSSVDAVHFMRQFSADHPEYRIEVLNTLVDVNEDETYGTVWISVLRTGVPNGTKMENVLRFRWRQTKNGWQCIKHSMLSPSPQLSGL